MPPPLGSDGAAASQHTSQPGSDGATSSQHTSQPGSDGTTASHPTSQTGSDGTTASQPTSQTGPGIIQPPLITTGYQSTLSTTTGGTSESVSDARDQTNTEHISQIPDSSQIKKKRERKSNPAKWKKNQAAADRLYGREHLTVKGKLVPAKSLKPVQCNCLYQSCKCFTIECQKDVFHTFWTELKSWEAKKTFICVHVEKLKTKTILDPETGKGIPKKQHFFYRYYLPLNGEKVRVCKNMFLACIDMSIDFVRGCLSKKKAGVFVGTDGRLGKEPPNKTAADRIELVKCHIDSFPKVESHYCRSSTTKLYLGPELSVSIMYNEYVKWCNNVKYVPPVSRSIYSEVFHTLNLGFHKPKKDQCNFCNYYNTMKENDKLTAEMQTRYDYHMAHKDRSRIEKANDKDICSNDCTKHTISFDMEAVLITPCNNICILYYKRKLEKYNFTTFNPSDKKGVCYTWHEGDAKRGSCEIGTCIFQYISSLPKYVKHVILYSDTCGGQNRNKYVLSVLLLCLKQCPWLEIIDQKFLESGHSQMEVDSVHARIEKTKKSLNISHPSEWDIVFQMARKSNPYNVCPLTFSDIIDAKKLSKQALINVNVDNNGDKVKWLNPYGDNIKWLRVCQGTLEVQFKYDFDQPFLTTNLTKRSCRSKQIPKSLSDLVMPPPRYSNPVGITAKKKKDLLSMCDELVIPERHHAFYRDLRVNINGRDCLPEPDVYEGDVDSDDE